MNLDFFKTVTLLCFENGLLPSTLIRQSAPYYHTTLNLKKNVQRILMHPSR